jgi:AcrR family transcriptional regulator
MSSSRRQLNKAATQDKLLSAARAIAKEGGPLSIANAAKRAGIGTATAYRYYSDPNQLRSDAALDLKMHEGEDSFAGEFNRRVAYETDPVARLLIAQRQMLDFVISNELDYRNFVGHEHLRLAEHMAKGRQIVPVGGRRIQMIEAALAPIADHMPPKMFESLLHALMLVTGPEPLFTLRDYGGLKDAEIFAINENVIRTIFARFFPAETISKPAQA